MTSKLTRLTDEELAELAFYAGESTCHPDPNYQLGFESLATGSAVLSIVRELQERRKAEKDNEPYGFTDGDRRGMIYEPQYADRLNNPLPVYRHAQPAPERDRVRREHAEWSQATFGNVGPVGPLKHLSKEALEAVAEPGDLSEWADMQFLLWDAQRRAGITDEQITQAMIEKLAVNKQREWPEPKDGEPRLHIKEQPAPVAEREPIAWLNDAYLARGVVDGEAGSEDAGPGYIPVYREAGPQPAPDDYQHLRNVQELYHGLEERLFALAQRIKGPSFDKYAHGISQAIDALEGAMKPAPVVPDKVTPEDVRWMLSQSDIDDGSQCRTDYGLEIGAKMWNACRAAMLQAAPVRSPMPDGVVTAEHRRVIEMLLNVCGAAFELADDSCQQDVDGEDCHVVPDDAFQKLSDALDEIENTLPTEDIDRPDVFLAWSAMSRAALKSLLQAGNSPVIPDTWIQVSDRMPGSQEVKSE